MVRSAACLLAAILAAAACDKKTPPPTPSPGGDGTETIRGTERLGWDQRAFDTAELEAFRYAIYVDGNRSEAADVSCGSSAGANGFACSSRLPAMTPGTHTLEIASFIVEGGATLESARSSPLRVNVTASGAIAAPIRPGDAGTSRDGVPLRVEAVADGLDEPVDLAFDAAGRLFIAERGGTIRVVEPETRRAAVARIDDVAAGGLLSLTLAPDFSESRLLYVVHTTPAAGGGENLRVARYRETHGRLGQRAVLLDGVPATSAEPSTVVRFGPDRKLYVAFDDGGSERNAGDPASLNGKLLRLNVDGTTPDDQAGGSPIHLTGQRSPRGVAWTASTLWIADGSDDAPERLIAAATPATRPLRATISATYPLDDHMGAADVLVYGSRAIPEFEGNLFVAAGDAGYILRARIDPVTGARIVATERLLEGMGSIRALAVGPDGAIYFATPSSIGRVTRR